MVADEAREMELVALKARVGMLLESVYIAVKTDAGNGFSSCRWWFEKHQRPEHGMLCSLISVLRYGGFTVEFPSTPEQVWLDISWR